MSALPRTVLVAVDGSVASLRAARLAVDFAASWHARVRAVAIADHEGAERLLDTGPSSAQPARERRQAHLRDALEYVRGFASDAGVDVEAVLRPRAGAEPYELILREADHCHADLLVVGSRAHRGLGRALLGSQAEHVLEFAQLPVVVVPESAAALPEGGG